MPDLFLWTVGAVYLGEERERERRGERVGISGSRMDAHAFAGDDAERFAVD